MSTTTALMPCDPIRDTDLAPALIHVLAAIPMASTDVLSAAIGKSIRTTRQRLQALINSGHVHGVYMGSDRCLWLDSSAFHEFDLNVYPCNTRRGMGILADRMLPVQTIYRMSLELDLIRPDTTFQWHSNRAYDAVAGRPGHWAALCWSGVWENQAAIRSRLSWFGEDLRGEWPRILACAVPDRWQAQILREVLDQFRLTPHAAIWVAAGESWQLPPRTHPPRASVGWPRAPELSASPPPRTGQDFVQSLADQLLTGPEGSKSSRASTIQRVLPVLEQWPGVRPTHIRGLLPKSVNGAQMADALDYMKKLRLATEDDGVYHPGPEAVTRAAHRDRVISSRASGKRPKTLRRLRTHDWRTIGVVSEFLKQGSDIAPGWRATDDHGPAGKIDPDAVVYLYSGPYGPGWHYLEYERRARNYAAIEYKLRSYLMPQRSNDWPVIFVVDTPEAERLFWHHGRNLRLITGVARKGAVPTLWSCFGVRVTLNSTDSSPGTGC